ncbi:MAG TPA: LacI family DNA-binding transcriptional regulator [Gaiellaceae bacterium]|nr:LacI family DNA-binding transcriptional regulator [Gaiellaceae bacterium]
MGAGSPTIVDVARRAGVSTGTVSNVLSGTRYVRPETKTRVEIALAELGFRPNKIARALSQRRTLTVAMVIPDVANPFFAELVRTVEQALAASGYAVLFGNAGNDPDAERRYLDEFADRRVDAIIAATAGVDPVYLRELARRLPTILVDRIVPGWDGDSVTGDSHAGMTAVIDHLVGLGHRVIAFIDGDTSLSSGRERRAAVVEALARHELSLAAEADGSFTLDAGHTLALELLRGHPKVTAICAANDLQALGVLRAAGELGLGVPDRLGLTGYDDIPYAAFADPPLTTIRQPTKQLAGEIVQLLHRRLDQPKATSIQVVVPPRLVVRSSAAPL